MFQIHLVLKNSSEVFRQAGKSRKKCGKKLQNLFSLGQANIQNDVHRKFCVSMSCFEHFSFNLLLPEAHPGHQ